MIIIKTYSVAIYCRLSVEDDNIDDSTSIKNQKKILTEYCKKNSLKIYDYYIDDGFSGTNYNRPAFIKLMDDIESGLVDMVLTKDLSRLGRNYLYTGYLLENYFVERRIRYVALMDNYDSLNNENELTPFKNLMNEFYAKDVSKKVRSSVQNNIKKGVLQTTSLPIYGYMYVNGERVINPETAPIVKYIFDQYKNNVCLADIAYNLEQMKVLSPMWYAKERLGYKKELDPKNKYKWHTNIMAKLLDSKDYMGYLVRGKTTSTFKSKKKTRVPHDMRYEFAGRFEPIVDEETWNKCHEIRERDKAKFTSGPATIYSGLCYCGICGGLLRYKKDVRKDGSALIRMTCRTKMEPKGGRIGIDTLDSLVKKELINLKKVILSHEQEFLNLALEATNGRIDINGKKQLESKIEKITNTIAAIDNHIIKAFEDYSNLKISESIYMELVRKDMNEKEKLEAEITEIKNELDVKKNETNYYDEANKYVSALKEITPSNVLDRVKIDNFISKIIVSANGPRKKREKEKLYVDIIYKAIDPLVKEFLLNG